MNVAVEISLPIVLLDPNLLVLVCQKGNTVSLSQDPFPGGWRAQSPKRRAWHKAKQLWGWLTKLETEWPSGYYEMDGRSKEMSLRSVFSTRNDYFFFQRPISMTIHSALRTKRWVLWNSKDLYPKNLPLWGKHEESHSVRETHKLSQPGERIPGAMVALGHRRCHGTARDCGDVGLIYNCCVWVVLP